jgi:hypothetical protein
LLALLLLFGLPSLLTLPKLLVLFTFGERSHQLQFELLQEPGVRERRRRNDPTLDVTAKYITHPVAEKRIATGGVIGIKGIKA